MLLAIIAVLCGSITASESTAIIKLRDLVSMNGTPGLHVLDLGPNLSVTSYLDARKSSKKQWTLPLPASPHLLPRDNDVNDDHDHGMEIMMIHAFETRLGITIRRDVPFLLFSPDGGPVRSWRQLRAARNEGGSRLLLHHSGGQFIYPGVRVGFRRNVTLPVGDGRAERTLTTLSLVPLVFRIDDFAAALELGPITARAEREMAPSHAVVPSSVATDFRTSTQMFIPHGQEAVMSELEHRVAALSHVPVSHQENAQVLRYEIGERYVHHHDYFEKKQFAHNAGLSALIEDGAKNRLATLFLYLRAPIEGGETSFPRAGGGTPVTDLTDCAAGLQVKPEAGSALLFYNLGADGAVDPFSLHAGCPVVKGTKWALNLWIWNKPDPWKKLQGYKAPIRKSKIEQPQATVKKDKRKVESTVATVATGSLKEEL